LLDVGNTCKFSHQMTYYYLINPAYLVGERPLSRSSTIIWPSYPRPPKRYWGLWRHFLWNHIKPMPTDIIPKWHQKCNLHQFSAFYKHRQTPHLYHKDQDGLTVFPLNRRQKSKFMASYRYVPYMCDTPFSPNDFYPVDVHQHKLGLSLVGHFPTSQLKDSHDRPPESLQEAFYWLP